MKNNNIIIYDDTCPLCAAYTRGFVAAGMIKKENRKNFTTIDASLLQLLDIKRCPNEIPVINSETKEVWYGIDGIAEILQTKIPFAKKAVSLPFIKLVLTKLYKLISYNRRLIVATNTGAGNFDCTPDFNYTYRTAFLLVCLVFNTAMLLPVHHFVLSNSVISISVTKLERAHFVLAGINILIACRLGKRMAFEYLGQVNMLATITILSIIPLLLLNKYQVIQQPVFNNIYLLLLIPFILKEYKRRMVFAGIIPDRPFIYFLNIISITIFLCYLL